MGEPGLDAETVLQLIQMVLRGAAYFFAAFAVLAVSTYAVFLGLQIFASPRRRKAQIAKAAQTALSAPAAEEKRDLVSVEPHLAEEATLSGGARCVKAETERFPAIAARAFNEGVINQRKKTGTLRFGKAFEILIWLAGLVVLTENILLLRQNRTLQETLAPQIMAGARLEKLAGLTLDGRLEQLALPSAESKLLVITFSPDCPACQANQDKWMKLASALEQKQIRVLWVSRDPLEITQDYCVKHGVRLSDVVADPPYRTYVQLGLARVPNTMLVRADGTVEKVWAGRLDQEGWSSIFAYFGERKETASLTRAELGARASDCGYELPQTSAKNCR